MRSGQTVVASPVFEIRPATPVAVIDAPDFEYEDEFGDTVPKDENVISGTGLTDGPTFTISLSGDTWVAAVGNDTYAGYATTTAALLASIFSMQSEPSGWNEIVRPALQPTDLTRVSNTIVRIEAPPDITYDINAPETIRVTVPRETVTGAQPIAADGIIVIKPEPGEAALSGAIFENNTEPDFIMARLPVPTHRHPAVAALGGDGCGLCGAPLEVNVRAGSSLVVRLRGDTFLPLDAATGPALVAGLKSATTVAEEASGWAAVVQPSLAWGSALALSEGDTVLTVTLPAFDGDASRYSIASPETLTVRLPAVALAGARDRMGAALFAALADGDTSFNKKDEFTPAYQDAFAEAAYISNFFDYFDSQLDGQYDGEVTEAELLSGLTSLAEKAGEVWGGEIGAFLAASARLAADDGLAASPSLLILAEATPIDLALGSGDIAFSPIPPLHEADIGASALTLRLSHDADALSDRWADAVRLNILGDSTLRKEFARGIRSYSSEHDEPNGWNAKVAPLIEGLAAWQPGGSLLITETDLTLRIAAVGGYAISAPETVEVKVPAAALKSAHVHSTAPATFVIHASPPFAVEMSGSLFVGAQTANVTGCPDPAICPTLNGSHAGEPGPWLADISIAAEKLTAPDEHKRFGALDIRVRGDTFVPAVGGDTAATAALLAGLVSYQGEPSGWNAIVLPALTAAHVRRRDERTVSISLPAAAGYRITAAETIVVRLNASVLSSDASEVRAPRRIVVRPAAPPPVEVESELRHMSGVATAAYVRNNSFWVNLTLNHEVCADNGRCARSYFPSSGQYSPSGAGSAGAGRLSPEYLLERYRGTHTVVADRDATRQQVIYSHRIRKVEQGVISFSEEGGWISSGNRGWGDAGWDDSPVRGWDSEFLSGRAAAPEVFYVSNQTLALRFAPLTTFAIEAPETLRIRVPLHAYCNDASCPHRLSGGSANVGSGPCGYVCLGGYPTGLGAPVWPDGNVPVQEHAELAGITLVIGADGGTLTTAGELTGTVRSEALRANANERGAEPSTLQLTLAGDRWSEKLTDELDEDRGGSDTGGPTLRSLLSGLRAAASPAAGWNERLHGDAGPMRAAVRARLADNYSLVLDFQSAAFATYLPRAPETISLSLPAEAVQSAVAYPPTPALGGFIVSVDAGAAKLSLRLGAHTTPVGATDERFFRSAEGHTLSIELTGGDTWRPGVGLGGALSMGLLDGFSSSFTSHPWDEPSRGWHDAVLPTLTSDDLTRVNDFTVELRLPQRARYEIVRPETITLAVPPSATTSGFGYAAPEVLEVRAIAGVATLRGSLLGDRQERTLRAGGQTLEIALEDDSWLPELADPAAHPELVAALFDGIRSNEDAAGGWGAVVQPTLDPSAVRLVDNATLRVTLPVRPDYRLHGAAETLNVTISPTLLASDQRVPAPPALRIVPTVTHPLVLSLIRDSWEYTIGDDNEYSTALLGALQSVQNESTGWNAAVRPILRFHDLEKIDATTVTLHVPQTYSFSIMQAETIRADIPAIALSSRSDTTAEPDLVILPSSGSAVMGGDLATGTIEHKLRTRTQNLVLDLDGNTFVPTLTADLAADVLAELTAECSPSSSCAASGWMSQLNSYSASQQLAAVALTGDELKQLVITFDAWDSYSISAPETVSVSLPASVLSSNQPLVIGSFVVLADVGAATLTGSLLGTPYEKTLQSAPLSDMVLSLTNDTWVDGLQNKDGVLQQIFDGIVGNTPCLGQGPGRRATPARRR